MPQVPFEGIPHFGPAVGGQRPVGPHRLGGQDDLVPHSGQSIARFDIRVKSNSCGLDRRDWRSRPFGAIIKVFKQAGEGQLELAASRRGLARSGPVEED